jgi:hypothetical protein
MGAAAIVITVKSPLWKYAARIWIMLVAAYFLWEAASYRRFYAWLAELQIAWFGGYVPLLTYMLLLFLGWLPIWVIRAILRARSKKEAAGLSAFDQAVARAKRLRALILGGALATFAAFLATLGLAYLLVPADDGPVQILAASEFETATIAEGPTRIIGGELGTIVTFGQNWWLNQNRAVYAPYHPPASEAKLTTVFVRLSVGRDDDLTKLQTRPAWRGILVENGVPGTVRAVYRSVGVQAADRYFTLYPDVQSIRATYWVQAAQLALLFLLLLLVGWWQSRRVKRLEEYRVASGAPA